MRRRLGFPVFLAAVFCGLLSRGQTESLSNRELAEQTFQRLVHVLGRGGLAPRLRVQTESEAASLPSARREQERVAFLRTLPGPLPRREIVIDEKTIVLCRAMKERAEDCLAFFLGHELAHYANHHDWGPHFASRMAASPQARAIAATDANQSEAKEAQADDMGLLYAALAGYDSLAAAPEALAATYEAYGIPADLPGYISLPERQRIAERSRAFLQRMLPLFDAATFALATGRFAAAATLYDAILESFPSREIFTDAAVARLGLATAADDEKYPWLIDGESRLPRPAVRRGAGIEPPERERLLRSASEFLRHALDLDPEYSVARVNLGFLALLQGETDRARAEFNDARKLSDSPAIAEVLKLGDAILLFREGRTGEARARLNEFGARNSADASIRSWSARISGEPLPSPEPLPRAGPSVGRSELWPGGRSPKHLAPARLQRFSFAGGLLIETAITSRYRWFSLRFSEDPADRVTAVVVTSAPDASATPLQPGLAREDWQRLLGDPRAQISLFPGHAYLYENLGLLLQTDGAGRIRQHVVYE